MGTPYNEPTTMLTGLSAEVPISRDIKLALGLKSPKIRDDYKIVEGAIENSRKCEKLIQYPENGEWVRGNNLKVSLAGVSAADWYLNGVKLAAYNPNISLNHAGINKITAILGDCRQTSEIFFEKNRLKKFNDIIILILTCLLVAIIYINLDFKIHRN